MKILESLISDWDVRQNRGIPMDHGQILYEAIIKLMMVKQNMLFEKKRSFLIQRNVFSIYFESSSNTSKYQAKLEPY